MNRAITCILTAATLLHAAQAAPLFTEDFNAEIRVKGRHRQAQSGLPIKHGYDVMPGWTRHGAKMPSHFVERAPGDWSLMVVAKTAGIPIRDAAGFQRLPNGNTVLCNWGGHGHVGKQAQIIEITPDKKVVWQVFDNEKFLTPLHIQLLDVQGDPARGQLCR
jgi:hypothetical protein